MNYRIPPDVIHYEVKLLFGLTAQDIMISGMAMLFGIQIFGVLPGLLLGGLALLAVKRYERFGNRSPLVYLALWLWHRYRPQQVFMPRVLPSGDDLHLTVQDWEGNDLIHLDGGGRA